MLYLVILNYIRPVDDVAVHLDAHKQWLVAHIQKRQILAAGPLPDQSGGFVLAACDSPQALDDMLALDAYAVHRLVEPRIQPLPAALRAEAFPDFWAPGAKAI